MKKSTVLVAELRPIVEDRYSTKALVSSIENNTHVNNLGFLLLGHLQSP